MKKTFILLTGIIVFFLSGLVGQSSAHETNNSNQLNISQESDPGLKIEDWMIKGEIWNQGKAISIVEEEDSKLELEAWMIESSLWD